MGIEGIDPRAAAATAGSVARSTAPPNRSAQAASPEAKRPAAPIGEQVRSTPERTEAPRDSTRIPVRQARVRIDEETRRVITQIVDENNEVIKQIPPDDLVKIAARFRRLQGLLFDERS